MTTLAQRTSGILERLPVERLELSRSGELLVQISDPGEPRWLSLDGNRERELDPAQDGGIPFAAELVRLRRERSARVLAWRPGRRMVVRLGGCDSQRASAVVKALRKGRMERALANHLAALGAASAAGLCVAEVLFVEPENAAFVLRDLGDSSVAVTADRAALFASLGTALARFQRAQGGRALEAHGVDAELEVLQTLAAKCVRVRGALPLRWEAARDSVERALRASSGAPRVLAHRDLHDQQLLDCDGAPALVDFDLLCLADEALDPGNLLAHLELRALQGLATHAGAKDCARAFRAGYGRLDDPEFEQRLRRWAAATFLRLALVYHLRPRYAHLGPLLVERAQAELAQERHGAR